ncbi:MAG: hypothetical protein JW821_07625, partial [Deltaproteobacteria bacterium]|nr:hypothetical protein [Deltaproteobacteria bacterium]
MNGVHSREMIRRVPPVDEGGSERLHRLLLAREEWLMHRILAYATARGYAKHAPTLREPWSLSISGLSA